MIRITGVTKMAEWIDQQNWTTDYCDYGFALTKSRHSESGEEVFEAVLTYPNGEVEVEDMMETFESAHEALNDMIIKELGETKVRVLFKEEEPDGNRTNRV